VFQLGSDGYDDSVNELTSTLKERDLKSGSFIVPVLGQAIELNTRVRKADGPMHQPANQQQEQCQQDLFIPLKVQQVEVEES